MRRVELTSGKVFDITKNETLLEAAGKAGICLPYSCKMGRCSACKTRVIRGESSTIQLEQGLTEAEKADGWVLSCVRKAETDLLLDVEDLTGVVLSKPKTLPCRIARMEILAPDVLGVWLRLPLTAVFEFMPGQYIEVLGNHGLRRSYSLACAGMADNLLELHVRAVQGGQMSQYWFEQAKLNDLLRLYGPLGTFFIRPAAHKHLVFLATGTGIAPVKAMLESIAEMPQEQRPASIRVLWGGRMPEDIYIDISAMPFGLQFTPVLSRAGETWTGARGYIQEVLLHTLPDWNNTVVYACGSDVMIQSARLALVQAGLPRARFYSDAFVCSSTYSIT